MAALIFASEQVISGAQYAMRLCAQTILPALFPFFVVSSLLCRLGLPGYVQKHLGSSSARLFHVSGAGISAFFIGITSGYPLGAAYIADMRKNGIINADECEHLLAFCNNSGPAFIIGAVGIGVFRSAGVGLFLYAIHILSAVITGLITRPKAAAKVIYTGEQSSTSLVKALPESIVQAVSSCLNVCGFVVCFSVLISVIDCRGWISLMCGYLSSVSGFEPGFLRAFIMGSLELGSGIGAMQKLLLCPINLALAAFLLGWGGVSVHFQTFALISDTELKGTLHFAGRLITASISAVIAYFISSLLLP